MNNLATCGPICAETEPRSVPRSQGYQLSHLELAITYEFAAARIRYEPDTGRLIRIKGRRAGKIAGHAGPDRYWRVSVNNKQVQGHRLAWLLTYGEWPLGLIDHIDGDTLNNRLDNLRLVTPMQNNFNRVVNSNNRLKVKGVKITRYGTFCTGITVRGRRLHLGSFKTVEEAAAKYAEAALRYHGEYARTSMLYPAGSAVPQAEGCAP